MTLRVLGPPELVADGRSFEIGPPRARVVLSMLALNPNRVTPVDHLVDAVWDTSPPATARSQIQICVSALRKVLQQTGQPIAIRTRPPGYLLDIATSDLDVEEFNRLVTTARDQANQGSDAEAATTLRSALALWRGPALAGVPSDLVQRGAAGLDEQRLAATEERARLDLALGRHQEIIGELRALADQQPLRELLYELLMLALHRSGRQAEALGVYRQARTTLVDEIGVEPGKSLQDMEQAILRRDPVLDPPSPSPGKHTQPTGLKSPLAAEETVARARRQALENLVPYQLPASIADFTGREEQIAAIKRLLAETEPATSPYAMRLVTISGAGGVGKSCLAIRTAHELAGSFPDGHLYADLQATGGEDGTARVLARFLRALGVAGTMIPDDLQERAEMYRSRLAGKRVLVVLDGVTSEEQVLPLLPGSPTCAVIATSRARLGGLSGAHAIDIGVFDLERSLELLAKIVGKDRVSAEHDAAVELVRLCDGLPLALRIAGARLVARPHWRIAGFVTRLADEAHRLDELTHHGLEIRSNVGLTYRSLDERAQHLFRLFALLQAPDFPAWTAAALLDTDLATGEDVLESLVEAHLLTTVDYSDGRPPRYRFHELVRVYATEELDRTESDGDRLAALRRVFGGLLGLAEQAHRIQYGGDYSIIHGPAPRWRPPGSPAVPITDPIEWLETERRSLVAAVRQSAAAGLDDLCWDLAFNLITLFEVKGFFDDWRETSQLAHDLTERTGNRLGQAATLHSLGTLHLFQKRLDQAVRTLTAGLEMFRAVGHVQGEGLALSNLAMVDEMRENHPAMLAGYAAALQAARTSGDRNDEAYVLRSLARYESYHGDIARAHDLYLEALAIVYALGNRRSQGQMHYRIGELYTHVGEYELAAEEHQRALELARDLGDQRGEAYVLHRLGVNEYRRGSPDGARKTLRGALAIAERVGERYVEANAHYELGVVASTTGDRAAAVTHLDHAAALFGELGSERRQAAALELRASITRVTG